MTTSPPVKAAKAAALDWSVDNCTIASTLGILGEKWTFIVLRDVFLGIRRFDDFIEHTGIPRQVLSNRLASLVDQGLLRRESYQEPGERARYEYRLTDKGMDAYPILVALREWGDKYTGRDGRPAAAHGPSRLWSVGRRTPAVRGRPRTDLAARGGAAPGSERAAPVIRWRSPRSPRR